MKFRDRIPALFAATSIITALFFSYYATRAIHHTLKGAPFVIPIATRVFIALCRYHVITGIGFVAVAVIFLIEVKSQSEQQRRMLQLVLMGAFLFLLGGWFFSMSIVYLGMDSVPEDGGPDEWLRHW